MNEKRNRTALKMAVRILLILSVSAVSLVIAQRVLTGFEGSVDGMPVIRGQVEDEEVDVEAVPEWQGDAAVTLSFDDGTSDYAFGRRVDGELVIATIEHGTEPLEDFLARLGLDYNEYALSSACELMSPDNAYFDDACAAYDPRRRPTDHPDVAGDVCSTCHLPNEIEQAYERSQSIVLAVNEDTVAASDRVMPAGHVEVEGKTCSSCHTVVGDDLPGVPVGDSSGRPPGHPDVAAGSCSTCHGGGDASGGGAPGGAIPAPDQPRPPGHPDVAADSCASCHGASGGTPTTPAPPDDHPSTGGRACTACHDSATGPSDDDEYDDEHEDEDDDDEHDDHEYEDDEHDDEDDEHEDDD